MKNLFFTIFLSLFIISAQSQCDYTINMQDSYGDGWNGASVDATVNGVSAGSFTFTTGSFSSGTLPTYTSDIVQFSFTSGLYDNEVTFDIIDPAGITIGTFGPNPQVGLFLTDTSTSTCAVPNCLPPNSLSTLNLTGVSADLTWVPGQANQTAWNVEWGPLGFTQGTGTTGNTTSTSYSISGLSPLTSYQFYVEGDCGGGSISSWAGPYTFTTTCIALIPPQTEDFSTGFPPTACWDQANDGDPGTGPLMIGTSSWITDGFGNNTTSGAVKINMYTTGKSDWILSPQYDISSGGPFQVEFDFGVFTWNQTTPGNLGSDDRVEILASTDGGATWIGLKNFNSSYNTAANGNHEIVSLSSITGTTVQFGFWASEGSVDDPEDNDVMVDNFAVVPVPNCPQPLNLNAFNVTSSTADLTWNPGGTETSWLLYLVPNGGSYSTVTPTVENNDTVTVSNLIPNAYYEYYVQSLCSPDSSFISGPYSFTVLCSVSGVPYFDNVEGHTPTINLGLSNCWNAYGSGYDWNIDNLGSTPSFNTGPSGAYSGSNYFYVEASAGAAGASTTLESPFIDISSLATPQLDFYYHMFGADMGNLFIDINDGSGWVAVDSLIGPQHSSDVDPWRNRIVSLNPFIGDTIQIKFTAIRGASFTGDISLDDIRVGEAPTCPQPLGLSVYNIGATNADFTWTPGGTETSWNVYAVTAGDPATSVSPIVATNDTITITGLSPNGAYDFYVEALCSGANSYISGPANATMLCSVSNAPFFDDVEAHTPTVSLGLSNCWNAYGTGFDWNIDALGSTPSLNTGPSGAYSGVNYFYTEASSGTAGAIASLESPQIDLSNLNVPQISFYYHMYGSTMGSLAIQVNNGSGWVTVDSISGQQQTSDTDPWLNRIIPISSYANDTIQVRFTGYKGTSFYSDMSIDDISIGEAPSCPQPSLLNALNITASSVDLTWTPNGGESSWNVYLVPFGSTIGSVTPLVVSNDTVNINTLISDFSYSYYVQAICGAGDTSAISGPFSFVTPCSSIAAPYTENFDSTSIARCWQIATTQGSGWVFSGNPGYAAATAGDHTGNGGSFAWIDFSSPVDVGAMLISPEIDALSLISPVLEFFFYSQNTNNTTLNELYVEHWDGNGYSVLDTIQENNSGWKKFTYNLSNATYGNNLIKIRFRGEASTGASPFYNDLLIDDFSIKEAPMNDIGTVSGTVDSPLVGCDLDSSKVTINIFNFGFSPQVGFDVQYTVNSIPVIETITDTLFPNDSMAYDFNASLDLSVDGSYVVDFKTNLNNDVDTTNDFYGTFTYENLPAPAGPTGFNDTICLNSGDTLMLTANSSAGTISWYDAQSGGTLLSTGDTLYSNANNTTTFYASVSNSVNDSLETTNIGGNGYQGNVFNITNTTGNPLTITGFGQGGTYNTANVVMEVWMYEGDYTNVISSSAGWIQVGNDTVTLSSGIASGYVAVSGAVIPTGATYGFRVGAVSSNVSYTNGTGTPGVSPWASNNDLIVTEGHGGAYPYYANNNPRNWNGVVHYLSEGCSGVTPVIGVVEDCSNLIELGVVGINIYPNPNNGRFTIVNNSNTPLISVKVTDMNGKLVYRSKVNNNNQINVNLENLNRGLYLVSIITEKGIQNKNVIIN